MKFSTLLEIIEEEIYKELAEINIIQELNTVDIDEKSVPTPYDKKNRRRMNSSQIKKRDSIGRAMKRSKKTVDSLKKKHGEDWESYLWYIATGKAMKGGE